jgi:hypothetical protein
MVGAINRIVRRGRIKGLGVTMISQRSAVIAKDVLTQIDTLIVLRTTGPQDRAAIDDWVSQNGSPAQRTRLLESLSSLATGTAFVWSPAWLSTFEQVRIRPRRTFDSSATPKVGATLPAPRILAAVDLEKVRERMAATIERMKADDPAELRRQLADARKQLQLLDRPATPQVVRVPTVPDGVREGLVHLHQRSLAFAADVEQLCNRISGSDGTNWDGAAGKFVPALPLSEFVPVVWPRKARPTSPAAQTVHGHGAARASSLEARGAGAELGKGERRVLTAIAQHGDGCSREQLSVLTGYTKSSRNTYLQRLSAAGLVTAGVWDTIVATAEGMAALGNEFQPLPIGAALRQHWLAELPPGERKVLEHLLVVYPKPASRENLSSVTGYTKSSRNTYLQRLAARKLVLFPNGREVVASGTLFGPER